MDAAALIQSGQVDEAWQALAASIREEPGRTDLRIFAFQVLVVKGEWQRAAKQLDVLSGGDAKLDLFAKVHRTLLACEALRREVFAGRRTPLVFGEPEAWVGHLVQAQAHLGRGEVAAAAELRGQALEDAPALAGTIDGTPFAWLADADSRFGPVFEVIIDGKYYWVPQARVQTLASEAPTDLRDLVWHPVTLTLTTGATVGGVIPSRYPGSEAGDDAARLARTTTWADLGHETWVGSGQRLLTTDSAEYPLLQVREIAFAAAPEA